ncbi:MAG: hypothetical protein ACPGGK_10500 [Pikeienuella sp.]
MPRLHLIAATLLSGLILSACQESIDQITGLDEELKQTAVKNQAGPEKFALKTVERLELGRLERGYMLTVVGAAPTVGYWAPELRMRNGGALATDSYYEFDLVAARPYETAVAESAPLNARLIRADFEITPEMLRAARGVRIYTTDGSVDGRF